jgi:catechol 2,3-dioxygenase-like lactoylglutathione lyase family enzyme
MKNMKKYLSLLSAILVLFVFISRCNDKKAPVAEVHEEVTVDNSEFSAGTIQIGVIVSDLEKSIDFYTNVVGMVKTGGFSIDADFGKKSGLTDGEPFDVTILKLKDSPEAAEWKLMSFGKESSHPQQQFIHDDVGMQYITIFVKSMKPFVERLKNHNIEFLEETPLFLPDGRQFVLIQDPDGSFIELIGSEE